MLKCKCRNRRKRERDKFGWVNNSIFAATVLKSFFRKLNQSQRIKFSWCAFIDKCKNSVQANDLDWTRRNVSALSNQIWHNKQKLFKFKLVDFKILLLLSIVVAMIFCVLKVGEGPWPTFKTHWSMFKWPLRINPPSWARPTIIVIKSLKNLRSKF